MWRRGDFCLRENKTRRHCGAGGPEGPPYSRRTCHAQVSAEKNRRYAHVAGRVNTQRSTSAIGGDTGSAVP
eukprot:1898962-Prymnesium_polylepis.1